MVLIVMHIWERTYEGAPWVGVGVAVPAMRS